MDSSDRKYAILNGHSLKIFFGTNGHEIAIDFDQIQNIKCKTKNVNGIFIVGGKIGNILNCIKEIKYILITLNSPLGKQYNPKDFNKRVTFVEDLKIEIIENGTGIILYKHPKGGFRPFLDTFPKYIEVLNADIFEYENKYITLAKVVLKWFVSSASIIFLSYISFLG